MGRKEELELQIDEWLVRENEEDEPDFRQDWVQEGIRLYKEYQKCRLSVSEKMSTYYTLAELYLEYGRSEKMISGNKKSAFKSLQKAARIAGQNGNPFYHLAFLAEQMTPGKEKWESVGFYAKEALERRLDLDKQIKLYCLLGKAYQQLGFQDSAAKCFSKSKELDVHDEYVLFRDKYIKKDTRDNKFHRLKFDGERMSRFAYRNHLIDQSRKRNDFYLLYIDRRGAILYGNGYSTELTMKNTELLKLIMESELGLTREEIFQNTTGAGSRTRRPESVKTEISRLRSLLRKDFKISEDLIETVGERGNTRYRWNPKFEKHILKE